MNYKVLRVIGVIMLILGIAAIIIAFMEGKKSAMGSIAAGGLPICIGGLLFGRSLRLGNQAAEKKAKDSGEGR